MFGLLVVLWLLVGFDWLGGLCVVGLVGLWCSGLSFLDLYDLLRGVVFGFAFAGLGLWWVCGGWILQIWFGGGIVVLRGVSLDWFGFGWWLWWLSWHFCC